MQTGIHYTKDKQKVRVLSVDEENKIAYVDSLNGQKKWVNEKEYADLTCETTTIEVALEETVLTDDLSENNTKPTKKISKKK